MTGPVTVEFTGARSGQGPLTWGQRAFWRLTEWLPPGDPYFNMPWALPAHGKPDLPTVLAALARLLGRHESLRTNWIAGSDVIGHQGAEQCGMVQRVAEHGWLTVGLVDAAGARPRALAGEIAAELAGKGFDYANELPVRCVVVMDGGRPRAVAFAFTHMAVDGRALDVIAGEWPRLLSGEPLPQAVPQPLDLAAEEESAEGAARGERALRYWRAALDRMPRPLFAAPRGAPEEPRFVKLGMESAALGAAVTRLAGRWGVSTGSVLLGAYAVLLSRLTGRGTVAMQLIVGNRHDPRLAPMVATLVQDGIFVLDVAHGSSLAEVVGAAHRGVLASYRHARYDPAAQRALIEETGPPPTAYFNDVRVAGGWPNLPPDPPVSPGRTFPVGAWPEVDADVFLSVGPATHTCRLDLLADTALLPREAIEAMLREVETLLVSEENT
ncbi:condensation domain-containing protein [Nonomuraea sp. 3N208]|uniref:condensation domain-containing protein n=1 Tax=Nonomuraea sp. 3N208 TaxID=3457421 RepID=UPI003FD290D7